MSDFEVTLLRVYKPDMLFIASDLRTLCDVISNGILLLNDGCVSGMFLEKWRGHHATGSLLKSLE